MKMAQKCVATSSSTHTSHRESECTNQRRIYEKKKKNLQVFSESLAIKKKTEAYARRLFELVRLLSIYASDSFMKSKMS